MEPSYISLSVINQYSYCPRRCGLIVIESEFFDNQHTLEGTHRHESVDHSVHRMKEGVRLEMAMPVWSHRFRLSGICDVVEFHSDGTVRPVEYKLGKRKKWINDDLQVAAQVICLEEMLNIQIHECAIYHHKSRRLRTVEMTAILREEVSKTINSIHDMIQSGILPSPTPYIERCGECSLKDCCQPELMRAATGEVANLIVR